MLIINADDFGKDMVTTDNIVFCFREKRITSTSAMVFMQDSERAASAGLENNLEVGLHLNFDDMFTGRPLAGRLTEYQGRVAKFLNSNKYSLLIFNPFLSREFDYLYKAQYEEFVRLYRRTPSHINGHHHMHLCSNMLIEGIIPKGQKVRTTFTFIKGERYTVNRLYRRLVHVVVKKRFVSTDMFFSVTLSEQRASLLRKMQLAKDHDVELMVHLSTREELEYLMRQDFMEAISSLTRGTYADLPIKRASNNGTGLDYTRSNS